MLARHPFAFWKAESGHSRLHDPMLRRFNNIDCYMVETASEHACAYAYPMQCVCTNLIRLLMFTKKGPHKSVGLDFIFLNSDVGSDQIDTSEALSATCSNRFRGFACSCVSCSQIVFRAVPSWLSVHGEVQHGTN